MSTATLKVDPYDIDLSPRETKTAPRIADGVKFMHPWLDVWKSEKGKAKSTRCTVAYRHVNENIWEAGFAFCSLKDQFKKTTGRELALASLNGGTPMTFRIPRGLDERDAIIRLIDSLPIRVENNDSTWIAQSWQTVSARRFSW